MHQSVTVPSGWGALFALRDGIVIQPLDLRRSHQLDKAQAVALGIPMFDEPRFTLSQVAAAAGCSVGTLRSWLQRKHWRLDMAIGDSPAEVNGKAHLVTLRRALHIGAAVELIRNDVDPARAFRAALSFVDIMNPEQEADGRARGDEGLFSDGYTLLAVYPGLEGGVVMWVDPDNSQNKPGRPANATPLLNIFFPRIIGGRQVSGTFVWLNMVDQRIRTTLLRDDS